MSIEEMLKNIMADQAQLGPRRGSEATFCLARSNLRERGPLWDRIAEGASNFGFNST
ncbi:hypothetical protein H5410_057298 [Solanum commersonii]|uniref:Uncharacterized protein n=1 Tax=Solanum commersonii TaxID=4109 RepID=A0A9J5WPR1_SOLCO|nr:hypothetical protein H5410_057298 [Solanum commersonii]